MIVSVVGVDGCGKTTLLRGIEHAPRPVRAAFLRMSDYANAERLARFRPEVSPGVNEWTDAPFGRLRPFATSLDFLRFYEQELQPAVESHDVVFVDRYYPSALAYGLALGVEPALMEALFARIERPAITVHVVLPMEQVRARLAARGAPEADENPDLLEQHDRMLRRIAPLQPHYLPIAGDAPLSEGPQLVWKTVESLLR